MSCIRFFSADVQEKKHEELVTVNFRGNVRWIPQTIYKSSCQVSSILNRFIIQLFTLPKTNMCTLKKVVQVIDILHSHDGSLDSRWNSNLSLLRWIDNSTQNYNFELSWNFISIQNFNLELNWHSNAANSSWNFILNQMIRRESASCMYLVKTLFQLCITSTSRVCLFVCLSVCTHSHG